MTFDRKAAEDTFEDFLVIMDDQIDWLIDQASHLGVTLDCSLDDLPKLEPLFDQMSEGKTKDEIAQLGITFARHLGEVVRQNHGGEWHLPLDEPTSANFNTPVIVGHTAIDGLEFAPLAVMRAYALRRKPGTIQRAVDADVKPNPLDLSGMVEK